MKILARHLEPYLNYAALQGIRREEIMHRMPSGSSSKNTINTKDFFECVSTLKDKLPCEQLGLKIGSYLNLSTAGVVYDISRRVTTNDEAMHYCHDYLRATFPCIQINYRKSKGWFHVALEIGNIDPEIEAVVLETTLTVMAREIKLFAGEDAKVILTSPHCTSHYPSPWRKNKSFSLLFGQSILETPLNKGNFIGLDILIRQYLTLLMELEEDGSWTQKVTRATLKLASPDLPGLGEVATLFQLTTRSLQRLLANEGTSFREIIHGIKKRICELLLHHNGLSIADVSHMLGYSEPAAFHHAFKQWKKSTPRSVRANLTRKSFTKRVDKLGKDGRR